MSACFQEEALQHGQGEMEEDCGGSLVSLGRGHQVFLFNLGTSRKQAAPWEGREAPVTARGPGAEGNAPAEDFHAAFRPGRSPTSPELAR